MIVRFGQRVAVLITLPIAVTFWLIQSFASRVWVLLVCRSFLGVAAGILVNCSPMYVLEIAHKSIRGELVGMLNFFQNLGVLFIGVLSKLGLSWRHFGFIFCGLLVVSFFSILLLPNSPRWLVTRGRVNEAHKSLVFFRGQHYDNQSEFNDITQQVTNTMVMGNNSWQQVQLILKRPTLQSFCLVTSISILHKFAGSNSVNAYIVLIFQATGSSLDPYSSSIICTALAVLGNLIQLFLVDRFGRKFLMITSFAISSICTAALGIYFYMFNNDSASNIEWLPIAAVASFLFFNSIGFAIIIILPGELLPTSCRSVGTPLSSTVGLLASFLSTSTFLYMMEVLSETGTFFFFTVFSLAVVVICACALTETQGRSLEELTQQRHEQVPAAATDSTIHATVQADMRITFIISRLLKDSATASVV